LLDGAAGKPFRAIRVVPSRWHSTKGMHSW